MKTIPIRRIQPRQAGTKPAGAFCIHSLEGLMAGKDMVQELHRHDFFFILAIAKGAGHHEIDFTPYTVTDGCVFFIRPGQVHKLTLRAGTTGYLLQFNAEFYYPKDKVPRQMLYPKSGKCQMDEKSAIRLRALLGHIADEQTHQQEGYQEAIKSSLNIIFIALARKWKNGTGGIAQASPQHQARLESLQGLVEAHAHQHKQVSQYADMMNLSAYQLNATTKATLGKTCSEFINEFVILESKRYLLATPSQVKEIAYQLGYEDVSYFSRLFKKHTGHTPEAFRQAFG